MKRRRFTRDLTCMAMDKEIGSGRYGTVFKTTDKESGKRYALKHIKMEGETQGFPVTAIREIKILKALDHENIIKLEEVVTYGNDQPDQKEKKELERTTDGDMDLSQFLKGSVFMVFEYVEFDLSALILSMKCMTPNLIKCYMKQLLSGVFYMHIKKILHRDLKTANILITRGNVLKIADWGLARSTFTSMQRLSPKVVTLWYRSPELLLETKKYGPEIDMWSIGCIFGEMACGHAILTGNVEIEQLDKIFQLCGSPKEGSDVEERLKQCDGWAKMISIGDKKTEEKASETKAGENADINDNPESKSKSSAPSVITTFYQGRLKQKFSGTCLGHEGIELLEKMLCLHPENRISAMESLDHSFFWSGNGTPSPSDLPPLRYEDAHEAEVTKKRQKKAEERQAKAKSQAGPGRGSTGGISKYRLKAPSTNVSGRSKQQKGGVGVKHAGFSGSMKRSQSDRNFPAESRHTSVHKSSSAITLTESAPKETSTHNP